MRVATILFAFAIPLCSQQPGKSIGTVTTRGDLILVTLNENALGKANPFDLAGRTLTFTPDTAGYRIENQMQEYPPAGIPDTNSRNIAFYTK